MGFFPFEILSGFGATMGMAMLLVFTKHIHGRYSNDLPIGVQKSHKIATPRIGGIAIFFGFLVILLTLDKPISGIALLICAAGIPALIFGLAEDLSKSVSIATRLFATIFSGLIFSWLSGYNLNSVDIFGLNSILALPFVGLAFTAFAIGGVANSINLIDGFHGLAAGTLVFASGAFAILGWRVGDLEFMTLALSFGGIFLGFLVINFPSGRLFLGDGGAYFSGYLVAVLAVMLPVRNPEISPWISLLVLGYPVTETLMSIARRLRRSSARLGQPDRGHFHHMVYDFIGKKAGHGASGNPLTSVFVWGLPIFALLSVSIIGLDFWPAFIGFGALVAVYLSAFTFLSRGFLSKAIGHHPVASPSKKAIGKI